MSVTARDIIHSALQELGEYSPGEPVDDSDAERGLSELNDLLSIWSNEDLMTYAYVTQGFTTVNGTRSYSIGPSGADITGVRPLKIEQAWITNTDGSKTGLEVITQSRWSSLSRTDRGQPTELFYKPLAPNGEVRLWLTPDHGYDVRFFSHVQFTTFTNLTTVVELPNGYVAALKKNLAVQLAPFFNRNPLPITVALAGEYKGRLKVKNMEIEEVSLDPLITLPMTANILTGQ